MPHVTTFGFVGQHRQSQPIPPVGLRPVTNRYAFPAFIASWSPEEATFASSYPPHIGYLAAGMLNTGYRLGKHSLFWPLKCFPDWSFDRTPRWSRSRPGNNPCGTGIAPANATNQTSEDRR